MPCSSVITASSLQPSWKTGIQFCVFPILSFQWASGSIFYLLGLWSRLVSSLPYLKGGNPTLLETLVPQITQVYISTRLESAQVKISCLLSTLHSPLSSLPLLLLSSLSSFLLSLMSPRLWSRVNLKRTPLTLRSSWMTSWTTFHTSADSKYCHSLPSLVVNRHNLSSALSPSLLS